MDPTEKYYSVHMEYNKLMHTLDWQPALVDRGIVRHLMDLSRANTGYLWRNSLRQYHGAMIKHMPEEG